MNKEFILEVLKLDNKMDYRQIVKSVFSIGKKHKINAEEMDLSLKMLMGKIEVPCMHYKVIAVDANRVSSHRNVQSDITMADRLRRSRNSVGKVFASKEDIYKYIMGLEGVSLGRIKYNKKLKELGVVL